MKLLEILSQNGVGSVEDQAVLNHTMDHIVKMCQSIELRDKSERLKAKFFVQQIPADEYPIVTTRVEYVEGKEEGTIFGKIYPKQDDWKYWIEVKFTVKDEKVKFQAALSGDKK